MLAEHRCCRERGAQAVVARSGSRGATGPVPLGVNHEELSSSEIASSREDACRARDHRIDNFDRIRTWEGSQDKAFEQLCFQLRDPEPPGVKLRKTADPDGGFVQRKVLTPNDFGSLADVARRINDFERLYNEEFSEPFGWKFTRDDLDELLARLKERQAGQLAAVA